MKNTFLLFVILGFTQFCLGQDLNAYKHVKVPEKFEFLKEPNQYKLNELTEFLLDKYGFQAYMEGGEIPPEIRKNSCEGLTADVKNNSNMFRTKLQVILEDCNGRQVFVSEEGVSRIKDFEKSYHDALRKAFESLDKVDYSYDSGEIAASPQVPDPQNQQPPLDSTVTGEVAKATPAERRAVLQPETAPAPAGLPVEGELQFKMENGLYYLTKTDNGYNFYQKEMSEPFASLISSRSKDTFIYSSITSQGVAYFDEQGNLVVEILNKDSGSPEVRVYEALD